MEKNKYLDFVEKQFENCFIDKGYIQESPVKITSQVDPSVDFVGSKISPLKHYVLNKNIGEKGIFLIQNCLRIQALESLQDTTPRVFGSYFKCMGVLTEPQLERVVSDTFEYLVEYLGVPLSDICIRINSQDKDLLQSVENIDKGIIREVNSSNANYRHKYGLDNEGITGRDFNIGIRKKDTDKFINAGTIVVMENDEGTIAVDMGISNCVLSMCKFGTDFAVAASRMSDVMNIDSVERAKFADALIVVSTLQNEDIMNHPSKHLRKKFRQYNHAIAFWQEIMQLSDKQIMEYMDSYIALEYKIDDFQSQKSWQLQLKR